MTDDMQQPIVEYRVQMADGWWSIPAHVIADHRAKYYEEKDGDDSSYREEYDFAIHDRLELTNWATGNMDWSDVVAHATKRDEPPRRIDYQDGWVNGKKRIVRQPPKWPSPRNAEMERAS